MKRLRGHLGLAPWDAQLTRNLRALVPYLGFMVLVVGMYSVLFHVIMLYVEGREHSWPTSVYWTLSVMSTLGFGDITFTSDVGRMFSVLVLMSGIVLLLIVLPFAFIRHVYAPWLEAQLRRRVPTAVPPGTRAHVLFIAWDSIAEDLVPRLAGEGVSCFVVDDDVVRASALHADGVPVVRGMVDDVATWERLHLDDARLIVLNQDDLMNTNVALTIRELSPDAPVVAIAEDEHSVDILELGGCDHVLPLKRMLGEQLANRVNGGHAQAHVIGRYRDLLIAEFSVHGTPLAGQTIAQSDLRQIAGVSILGVRERSRIHPPDSGLMLGDLALLVVAGSADAIHRLNEFLWIYDTNTNPVVVLGAGKVGCAAARALKQRSVPVHMVERSPEVAAQIRRLPDRMVVGDAADREVMHEAGVDEAPAVLLTTNRDETNIYLAAYVRRISPEAQIVSRITHERNLTSIHRAGADITLSYDALAVERILSLLHDRPPVILGEDMAFHELPCPERLEGRTLEEGAVGRRTGLVVVGLESNGALTTDPRGSTRLEHGCRLLAMGTAEQVDRFRELYG